LGRSKPQTSGRPRGIAVDWGIPVIQQDLDDKRIFSFYIDINR
jgi:hypothetical protein